MSINLKGDVTSNTGEYLPAPYIDQVIVEGDKTLRFKYSVFLQEGIDQYVNTTAGIVTGAEAYQATLEENVYVYRVYLFNMPDTGFYEDIVNGKINPLALIALSGSSYNDARRVGEIRQPGLIWASNSGLDDYTVETIYDESGNPIQKYSSEDEKSLENADPDSADRLWPDGWSSVDSFQAIVFTSTIDVTDLEDKAEADINIPLLNIQTSDISYINVFENGELVNRYLSEYIDEFGIVYNDTPLIAIDSLVYKPDQTTHEQIVANFQDLLDQYSAEYQKEENAKFKRLVDKISFILEVYGEEADLLVQLDALRRVFPDKTPAKLIGKFYKRFRKRISNVNKVIKKGPPLTRKIIYNTKIVDLRPIAAGDIVTSLGYESSPTAENYIYKDWSPSDMEIDMGPFTSDYDVVAGHFFFDYEKALRRTSIISEVFDINKLEKWGVHTPYSFFEVTAINANRTGYITAIDESTSVAVISETGENIDIGCVFQSGQDYPTIDHSYVFDRSPEGTYYVIIEPEGETYTDTTTGETYGFFDTPYGPPGAGTSNWAGGGYVTSLVLRHYVNPYNGQFSTIDNYRLMCYELLDYQKDSTATEYTVNISINDSTLDVIEALVQSASDAYALLIEYSDYADHLCSFNEDIGVFNSFFSEAMLTQYPDPTTAPWYAAPVNYLLHLDLIYDTYGGDIDKITKAAEEISQQISPTVGTKEAIEDFRSVFEDFISNVYGDGSRVADLVDDAASWWSSGPALVAFQTTLAIPGRTAATVVSTYESCTSDSQCTVDGFTCQDGWCKFAGAAPEEAPVLPCRDVMIEDAEYEAYVAEINRLYDESANLGWESAVDMAAMSTGACDGTAEYDLTPATYPGGLCSENDDYNNRVDYYIESCHDMSISSGSGFPTYWDYMGARYYCKVDDVAKRNITCFSCENAPDQTPCKIA